MTKDVLEYSLVSNNNFNKKVLPILNHAITCTLKNLITLLFWHQNPKIKCSSWVPVCTYLRYYIRVSPCYKCTTAGCWLAAITMCIVRFRGLCDVIGTLGVVRGTWHIGQGWRHTGVTKLHYTRTRWNTRNSRWVNTMIQTDVQQYYMIQVWGEGDCERVLSASLFNNI